MGSYSEIDIEYREMEAIASASRARAEQAAFIEETELGSRVGSEPIDENEKFRRDMEAVFWSREFIKAVFFTNNNIKKKTAFERKQINRSLQKPRIFGTDWKPYTHKLFGGDA